MHLRTSTTKTVCQGYSSETTVQNFYAGTCGHLGIKLTVSLCDSSENFFFKLLQIRVGQSWWYQKTWKKWPYAVFIHPWTCAYKLLICMPIFSQSWQNLVCSTCISVAEEKHKIHALGHYPHPIPTLRLYTYWIKMVKIDVWRAFLLLIVMETYAYVGLQMTFSMTQKWNH